MKVCPIQRFGMKTVMERRLQRGQDGGPGVGPNRVKAPAGIDPGLPELRRGRCEPARDGGECDQANDGSNTLHLDKPHPKAWWSQVDPTTAPIMRVHPRPTR